MVKGTDRTHRRPLQLHACTKRQKKRDVQHKDAPNTNATITVSAIKKDRPGAATAKEKNKENTQRDVQHKDAPNTNTACWPLYSRGAVRYRVRCVTLVF